MELEYKDIVYIVPNTIDKTHIPFCFGVLDPVANSNRFYQCSGSFVDVSDQDHEARYEIAKPCDEEPMSEAQFTDFLDTGKGVHRLQMVHPNVGISRIQSNNRINVFEHRVVAFLNRFRNFEYSLNYLDTVLFRFDTQ